MALDESDLLADVRERLFAASSAAKVIGAEIELIPLFDRTKAPVPIASETGPSLTRTIRKCAGRLGWTESTPSGIAEWSTPDRSRISFEPGGQIEISSAPHQSCSALIASLERTAQDLAAAARDDGVQLLALGTDPYNDVADVPLQLRSDRYVRMDRYLAARGEAGRRMMRQTASIQISVEHGPKPFERWRLLNSLAPYLIAIFANSSRYAGRDTAHASYRAHFWRELDATRTGLPFDAADAPSRYAEFALNAGALRAENGAGELHSFRSQLGDERLDAGDWRFHLSTLFPEIRPREYFEIRSPDMIAPENLAAPLVLIAGLVYDERAAADAAAAAGPPDESLLRSAGRVGLGDPQIRSRAADLVRIAIDGAERLPPEYLTAGDRTRATGWLRARVQ